MEERLDEVASNIDLELHPSHYKIQDIIEPSLFPYIKGNNWRGHPFVTSNSKLPIIIYKFSSIFMGIF